MVFQAFDSDRYLVSGHVVRPSALNLLGVECIIFWAVAIDHLDIAATLLSPQTVSVGLHRN